MILWHIFQVANCSQWIRKAQILRITPVPVFQVHNKILWHSKYFCDSIIKCFGKIVSGTALQFHHNSDGAYLKPVPYSEFVPNKYALQMQWLQSVNCNHMCHNIIS